MKKFIIVLALIVGVFTIFSLHQMTAEALSPNCGPSAVVKCGVYKQEEMNAAQADAKALYAHLGISTDLSQAKIGTVYPDGTVKVDGKVVATGAMTFGRVNRTGKDEVVKGFYKHTIREGLINEAVESYVFLDANGKFIGAIIKSCGNPVVATPVTPEKPKPQTITCDVLELLDKNADKRSVKVKLTGTATNTTISGYKIDFGDGTIVANQTAEHTYISDGEYTIVGHVSGKVNGESTSVTAPSCKKTVSFEKKTEALQCTLLKLDAYDKTKRYVKVTVTGTANNTTITGYKIDFGDGTVVNKQTAEHTYTKDGEYKIIGYVTGKVDGKDQTVSYKDCEQAVVFSTTPTPPKEEELPNTGAGALVGLFTGASVLGTLGYRAWAQRRNG